MSVWAEQLHPDPLAEDVVPESVPHSRTARLVAQVISLALDPDGFDTAERLGLRWADGRTSAPDFFVLPGGSLSWDTTSYAPESDGPKPLVAVEVAVSSPADPAALVRRGVPTYLIYPDPPFVIRYHPTDGPMNAVPDGVACDDLGGVSFRTDGERLAIVDLRGDAWSDPDEHLRGLQRRGDAAEALLAERDAEIAERDAEIAERDAEIADLRRRLGDGTPTR